MAKKGTWVERTFNSFNFSIILSGTGSYFLNDVEHPVKAPHILLQWPGMPMKYGPRPRGSTWEELFIMYDVSAIDHFQHWGITPGERSVWAIRDSRRVREQIEHLVDCLASPVAHGFADRVDRICDRLLVESLLGEMNVEIDEVQQAVHDIHRHVMNHLSENHNFDQLSRHAGLSPMTFRRHWAAQYKVPPARYVMRQRVSEACRRLAETRDSVAGIAHRLGFEDPLYFSRRFRIETGMTPTTYRKLYHH